MKFINAPTSFDYVQGTAFGPHFTIYDGFKTYISHPFSIHAHVCTAHTCLHTHIYAEILVTIFITAWTNATMNIFDIEVIYTVNIKL